MQKKQNKLPKRLEVLQCGESGHPEVSSIAFE